METLILCGIYLVKLACYWLGLRILFEVNYKTKIWIIFGIVWPVIINYLPTDNAVERNTLLTICVISIMLVSVEGTMLEKGSKLILVFLLLECIDGLFVHPCEQILLFFNKSPQTNIKYLIITYCTVGSIFLFDLIKKKMNNKKAHINSVIYYLIALIAIFMMFCLSILNHVKEYLPNNQYAVICNVLNIVILICVFLLVVFVIYIKNTHERMEQLLKTEQILKESQVNYYKQILKKETDTRQYRHDMVNHLVYMQDILRKGKIDNAQKYLMNILGGFKKIQNTYYVIGNEMVDTIMNYFFGMLSDDIQIEIYGRCPVEIAMEDTEVCTVFSNLFQNAVEEILENKIQNAKIIVKVQKGRRYVEYAIINSMHSMIDEKCIHKNGLPKSHKLDKRNHGIGMMNVKRAVEKSHGKFEWHQKDGYFCVSIVLPIKL